jgi:hypothetical protein
VCARVSVCPSAHVAVWTNVLQQGMATGHEQRLPVTATAVGPWSGSAGLLRQKGSSGCSSADNGPSQRLYSKVSQEDVSSSSGLLERPSAPGQAQQACCIEREQRQAATGRAGGRAAAKRRSPAKASGECHWSPGRAGLGSSWPQPIAARALGSAQRLPIPRAL